MARKKAKLKTLPKDFIVYGGHTLSCNSILYIHKYREVGREKNYFILDTKKTYLKISKRGKQENVCVCVCEPQTTEGTQMKQKARLNTKVDVKGESHQ